MLLNDQERQIAIAESLKLNQLHRRRLIRHVQRLSEQKNRSSRQETEVAKRRKQIELIEAEQAAQREAIGITVAAEAEKQAANDKAEAINIGAEAQAAKTKIIAQAQAESEKILAEASKQKFLAEAEGKRALHEAENLLSSQVVDMKIRLAIIEHLASIIAASVKPVEAIKDLKIIQVEGLTGGGGHFDKESVSQGSFADQLVSSALRYRGRLHLLMRY